MSGAATIQVDVLEINKFMVTFDNVNKHIVDLIADELNNNHASEVAFAGTRRPDREEDVIEMEVHVTRHGVDVAGLITTAARDQSKLYRDLRTVMLYFF
jgi:hypothetical protein